MACEDANPKLVKFVTVADVDDEKRFDASFKQIWKLKFGHKAVFVLWWINNLDNISVFSTWNFPN